MVPLAIKGDEMQNLTDDELASMLNQAINEAESRASARGKLVILQLLQGAHTLLKAAGDQCVCDEDIEVSPMSIGGDKS